MYRRHLSSVIKEASRKYPVILLTGPRQSGKTTLATTLFKDYTYILLEEPDQRRLATEDPRGFFKHYSGSLILDEVQNVPDLLSYIQGIIDQPTSKRQFILTGSQHLLLMEKVSQTLAGRVRIIYLLPFSFRELRKVEAPFYYNDLDVKKASPFKRSLEDILFTGGYPRIYQKKLNPTEWLSQYYQTYIERDVRKLVNVSDLDIFDRFTRLCAGRAAQLLNYESLGSDTGVSQPTAHKWFNILQATFILFKLEPHFKNFNKRMIKTPKLYFYDTGLLCYLLRITDRKQLFEHPLKGAIFENWVVSELLKSYFHRGLEAPLYFWRDQKGHETDLLIDEGKYLFPIEIKSAGTFHPDFLKGPQYLNELQGRKDLLQGLCVYGGTESFTFKNYQVLSWGDL